MELTEAGASHNSCQRRGGTLPGDGVAHGECAWVGRHLLARACVVAWIGVG